VASDTKSKSDGASPGQERGLSYVAQLALDDARRKAVSPNPSRSFTETILPIIGGVAGAGVILLIMGAIVVWVRLVAAGLPAEQGLAATPKETLAVTGAHVLLVPLFFAALSAIGSNYYLALRIHAIIEADARGEDPPLTKWQKTKAGIGRVWGWLMKHPTKYPIYLILVPLFLVTWPVGLLMGFLSRHKLSALWWFVVFPFSWFWGAIALSYGCAYAWADHVYTTSPSMNRGLRSIKLYVWAGFAVAAVVTALAGQIEKPSHLAPATVTLNKGHPIAGLFVASDPEAIYLGRGHSLEEIPRAQIRDIQISRTKEKPSPPSLLTRLVDLVL